MITDSIRVDLGVFARKMHAENAPRRDDFPLEQKDAKILEYSLCPLFVLSNLKDGVLFPESNLFFFFSWK